MGRATDFCCCALPLVNSGSYGILLLNFLIGIATCAIAFGPPEIVALSGVSLAGTKYPIGIIAILLAVWQLVGALGISSERPSLYRLYLHVHRAALALLFLLAIIFLIVGGAQKSKVRTHCLTQFGFNPPANTAGASGFESVDSDVYQTVSHKLCNSFIDAQVGCMAGLIIVLFALEVRLLSAHLRASRTRDAHAWLRTTACLPRLRARLAASRLVG